MSSRNRKNIHNKKNIETFVDNSKPKVSNLSSSRTAPQDWMQYETGPYKRLPTIQEAIIDGYLMSSYDPTVGSCITIIRQFILSKLGNYNHEDENINAFIDEALEQVNGGMRGVTSSLLSCLWAGFAVAEKVWNTKDGTWTVDAINLINPLTFFDRFDNSIGIKYNPESGKVTEFVQKRWKMNEIEIVHKAEDVIYWPFQKELTEDIFGRRLTDKARQSWYMKSKLELYWSIFLERFAHPTPIFSVPKGTQMDENGRIITNSDYYGQFIGLLAPGNGLAIESGPDETFDFKLLESNNNGEGYENSIKYHNKELFKSMLIPEDLITSTDSGSRAKVETSLDIFLLLIESIREELGVILIDQLIKPMIEYNFGPQDNYGEWKFEPVRDDDLEGLANVLNLLNLSTAVHYTVEDEASIRDRFSGVGLVDMDSINQEELDKAKENTSVPPIGYNNGQSD